MRVGGVPARLLKHRRRAPRGTATAEGGEGATPARRDMRPNESYRRDMRPGGVPEPLLQERRGGNSDEGRDAVLGDRADALRGGDADLGDVLDAAGQGGELGRPDVR